jgi:hypothetical protein
MLDRLTCEACGCVSRGEADGWAAFLGDDTEGIEPLGVGIFCPRCAALQLDHRPEHGGDYT